MSTQVLTGKEKVAVLLVELGTPVAGPLTLGMKPGYMEKLIATISHLSSSALETREEVLHETYAWCAASLLTGSLGREEAWTSLSQAWGEEKAQEVMNQIPNEGEGKLHPLEQAWDVKETEISVMQERIATFASERRVDLIRYLEHIMES